MDIINDKKIKEFDGDEYIKIGDIVKPFWEQGISEKPPRFVILMGGIGSGKTTMRRKFLGEGYVNFDFNEIDKAIKDFIGKDYPRIIEYSVLACDIILKESILEKKNIVIEIIGDNYEQIAPVITKMKELGYDVKLIPITCDIEEAKKRHLLATKEDKDYMSAYYSQDLTLFSFFNYFGLGEMPTNQS